MHTVSRDEIVKLAMLSNLKLTSNEIDELQADIGNILGYIEQLNELDTTGVTPAYQVTGLKNVSRDDVVDEGNVRREQLLALAPDTQDLQIKVPKVL